MIRSLLPAGAVGADAFGDAPEGVLLPAEEAAVAGVAAGRRREFATVRHCARRALRELAGDRPGGAARDPVALLPDRDGVPRWPGGTVGSMTHTRGYRAAAVAPAARVTRLGIDAEPDRPLRAGVLETIALPAERSALAAASGAGGACRDRLLFCAKEAAYKAWFPHARTRLGFRDVEIVFDARAGALPAAGLPAAGAPAVLGGFRAYVRHGSGDVLRGRWGAGSGLLVAVVADDADDAYAEAALGPPGADRGH
ncbi:4'-phosphopantetheinyl transferase superfamily protein [Streptomyces subrutilus]|uniref:4'-phosphopantetheinyl transferase family protein n=1 Tax=Streptomyces subrutilus TaxID=36818 RepID=UPI0033CC2C27